MPLVDKVSVGNKKPNIAITVIHKDKTVEHYRIVEQTGTVTKYTRAKE